MGGASLQLGTGVAAVVAAGVDPGEDLLVATGDGVPEPAGLEPGDVPEGEATGPGAGLLLGEARGLGVGVELGLGEVPEGQRLQLAAQYPPSGAPATNMKGSPHLPKLACS